MLSYNTLIVLIGTSLLGASAGLVGSYAVLRRRSLTGDALAHAALPGLCLAFLIVGERSLPAMLCGAFISGVLGINVISALRRWTRIKEDAAIGIVLSVFFGAGIVLSRLIQNWTTAGSKAGLDSYILGKTAGMIRQDVLFIAGLSLGCVAIIIVLFKEFQLTVFDPGFARVQGWPALLLDLLLMTLVAVAVIIGLPAVGVVMIASLLILPGATARFWTERLSTMLMLSALFGLAIGAIGTLASASYSMLPTGPIIVLTGTILFLISLLIAPRRGALARWFQERRFRTRLAERKLLMVLDELSESGAHALTRHEIAAARSWSSRQLGPLLNNLVRSGDLEAHVGEYRLTAPGRERAAAATHDHRLWELLLTEFRELAGDAHGFDAEPISDVIPEPIVAQLEQVLSERARQPA